MRSSCNSSGTSTTNTLVVRGKSLNGEKFFGGTKVSKLNNTINGNKNVATLDVTMHDLVGVEVLKTQQDLASENANDFFRKDTKT